MKRVFALVLTLALAAALTAPALAAEFTDVPASHTFHDAIAACSASGIVGGYSDGTFRPGNSVTKNHFCAMLARAFYPEQAEHFNTDQYKNAYGTFGPTNVALANNGTLNKTSFQYQYDGKSTVMNTGINRYDMAQLMTNIMEAKGFTASSAQKAAAQAKIADYSAIPDQYKDAVAAVYALGIIGGYADGTFGGTVTMNRGQAAVVIHRMQQYVPASAPAGAAPEAAVEAEPDSAEPPTAAAGTLANGNPITEDNVTEILEQLKTKYPNGTSFANGYRGLGSGRNPATNCIAKIVSTYNTTSGRRCSTSIGCGGWAAFVADEIFGQTNVTWKKTDMANVRPGDLLIILDADGYLEHVSICVGPVDGYPTTKRIYTTDANGRDGPNGYVIGWNRCVTAGINIDVYTAYPD